MKTVDCVKEVGLLGGGQGTPVQTSVSRKHWQHQFPEYEPLLTDDRVLALPKRDWLALHSSRCCSLDNILWNRCSRSGCCHCEGDGHKLCEELHDFGCDVLIEVEIRVEVMNNKRAARWLL